MRKAVELHSDACPYYIYVHLITLKYRRNLLNCEQYPRILITYNHFTPYKCEYEKSVSLLIDYDVRNMVAFYKMTAKIGFIINGHINDMYPFVLIMRWRLPRLKRFVFEWPDIIRGREGRSFHHLTNYFWHILLLIYSQHPSALCCIEKYSIRHEARNIQAQTVRVHENSIVNIIITHFLLSDLTSLSTYRITLLIR